MGRRSSMSTHIGSGRWARSTTSTWTRRSSESVTVVEWGQGKVEELSADRLEVTLHRGSDETDETRTASVRAVGDRWVGVDLGPIAG